MTLLTALSLLPALLLVLAAGRVLFSLLLEDLLGDASALAFSALLGATAVVALYLPAMLSGHPALVWTVGLAAIASGLARGGLFRRLLAELRRDGPRLAAFLAVGVVVTALAHGRQVSFEDGGLAWRGTLGRDVLSYVSATNALLRDCPPRILGTDGEEPLLYHAFTMIVHGWAATLSAASVPETYFRLLPPLALALAFESHVVLLRTWFPAARGVAVAALAPLFAMDLDPWLRAFGVAPSDVFENRTATTMLVSPSFAPGQAAACLVLAGFLHVLAQPGSLATNRRAAIALGVLAGSVVGWKLPTFVVLAVGLAVLLPRLLRQEGGRRTSLVAASAAATALATYAVCFQWPRLLGETAPAASFYTLSLLPGFGTGGPRASGALGVAGLIVLYVLAGAGPRLLRLRELAAKARSDPGTAGVLAMCAAGLALPLLLGTETYAEEKYLRRCGGYFLALLTAALVLRDVAERGVRLRGLLELSVLGVFSAGTFAFLFATAPMDARLAAADVSALRTLDDRTQRILVSPGARDRYEYAITAVSGQRVWHEATLYLPFANLDLDAAAFAELSASPRPDLIHTHSEAIAAQRPFDTFLVLTSELGRYPHLAGPAFDTLASGPNVTLVRRRRSER